ncbi:TetR/AcrR family transcriptional regulator [Saccharopolyspora erythraea]|uniref:TetR/AcrR family transcriptional regulator n=1 Tax=Saccharopolyspora erythraea TaxID=1836 RepID=UPI001BA7D1DC|nr:TetR/AcrR family transcriptional regulator [Saccharopolyspora erythraea]QUH01402.1 TetR/AcrR family transcriptional regulator [Saccharopolyspora erythraea]
MRNSLAKLTPAGRRVLDVAAELFYRQGIHAVGVEAIAAEAGVTKKTLYACFGSKDNLVTAYLTERDQRWREWLTEWVEQRADSAEEKVLGAYDALAAWMREDFRGCAFVNALAELPSPDHPAREVIVGQKRWMRDYFAELAAKAGAGDPDDFAKSALLLYEGVTVAESAGIGGTTDQAKKVAAALLRAAV